MGNTRGESLQAATASQILAEMAVQRMTRQELAKRVGIAHNTLGRYLNGERDIPFPVLLNIADRLGIDVRELLRRAYVRIGVEDVK